MKKPTVLSTLYLLKEDFNVLIQIVNEGKN